MESLMTLLAETRLAPLQCVTWGHPATTGSLNMDYYLSSELMEPPGAEECYSEQLVRLPGIGVHYRKPMIPRPLIDARRSRFGLRDDSTVFLCCQSMFKYLPEHDDVFVRIAQAIPNAQFMFLQQNPEVGFSFGERLARAFGHAGLDFTKHCVIRPHLGRPDYSSLNLASDVYLDSMEWSGFNTTMEAVACGLPVVTLPGRFMRGLHSYAILTQLGVTETIAANKDEFVAIATRLGVDVEYRRSVVARMAERHSELYSDVRSVKAVEDFLEEAVRARLG
jgi:predicted O-linked N-acetylglucosamine transferase (SPINDLY family)